MNTLKHFQISAIAALTLVWVFPVNADTIPLSALDLQQMSVGWSVPKVDRSIVDTPISIGGTSFTHGIGTHAESRFKIDLNKNATRFLAHVGLSDDIAPQGSVEFIVLLDDQEVWRSGLMHGGDAAKPVDIDLSNAATLLLIVTDVGDGSEDDHAIWADARIDMKPGSPKPSAIPLHPIIQLKTANLSLDFTVSDDGRLLQLPIGGEGGEKARPIDEAYPQWGDGYYHEPALQITHADGNTSTRLNYQKSHRFQEADGRERLDILLHDPAYPLEVTLCFRAHHELDIIEQWTEIHNIGEPEIKIERMASSALNLNPSAVQLTQFHGDWNQEMQASSEVLSPGTKILDSKIGVRAHQFRNPSFLLSFDGDAKENDGRVLAGTLAWSGSFQFAFDHTDASLRALCGVNPFASAYHLKAGETFTTPAMIWSWSKQGLGLMTRNLHAWARDFGIREGHGNRRILLNNWEATSFDFDFDRIVSLYDPAVAIGSELFLLDDGWFANKYPRVDDHAGLGDWEPNRERLPDGLAPLAAEATKRGLDFGIWIEPEMVNPKSELFEKHPDWVISQPKRELELQRNQLVLDLTRPEVWDFEWEVIQSALGVPNVTYAKWDCNRYLTQPGSSWLAPDRQSHLWIDYTHALYKLMAKTAESYPDTTLMLCSGGGGRVDYGALRYFHEFWPSDNTDPVARVPMQWNYSYFFPAAAMACHVTHMGDRPMHFACSVAMSGRFGMDLDLVKLSASETAVCEGAIQAYKEIRDVVFHGDIHRLESPIDTPRGVLSYVSTDRKQAVAFVYQLKNDDNRPIKLEGLDPQHRYTIREMNPAPGRAALTQEGQVFTGEELMRDGILPTCTQAEEACVIQLH